MGPGINKAAVLEQNWAMQLNWKHPCKSWFCVLSLLVLIIWSGITDLMQHYCRCHFVKPLWLKAWKKAIAVASRNTGQRCQIVPEPENLFQSHCLRTAIVCMFFLKCIVQCIFDHFCKRGNFVRVEGSCNMPSSWKLSEDIPCIIFYHMATWPAQSILSWDWQAFRGHCKSLRQSHHMTWSSAQERLLGSINKADVFSISTTCSSPWDFVDTKRQLVKKVTLSGLKTSFYGGRMPETPDEPTLPMTGVDPDACLLKDQVSTRWFSKEILHPCLWKCF